MTGATLRLTAASPLQTRRTVIEAARQAVVWVDQQAPAACRRYRVAVTELAQQLGIVLRQRSELQARARLHVYAERDSPAPSLWGDDRAQVHEIHLRSNLRESTRRFAVAHEVGHMVLHQQHPDLAAALSERWHEYFANTFARELLVPMAFRSEIRAHFRSAAEPVALLRLSDGLGLSVRTVLRFAVSDHDWLVGLDRVWLDMRYGPNRRTGRDPRLRLYRAYLDGDRWFIPDNRTEEGLFGNEGWLGNVGNRMSVREGSISISRRGEQPGQRFIAERVRVTLSAVRLHASKRQDGVELLVCANPSPRASADGAQTALPVP